MQNVTFILTGSNDAPVIPFTITEVAIDEVADDAPGEGVQVHSASGSVDFSDLDLSDSHSLLVLVGGPGYFGTFSAAVGDDSTGDGTGRLDWSFQVSDAEIEHLGAGETLRQRYDLALDDGHGGGAMQNVTFILTGSNDAPVITGAAAAVAISELADGEAGEGTQVHSAGGSVDFSDLDLSDEHSAWVIVGPGYYGTLNTSITDSATGDGAGTVSWNFEVSDGAIEHLGANDSLTQLYQIAVDDGHGGAATQGVTITINGANDAPDINAAASDTSGSVFEDGSRHDSGQLVAVDADQNSTLTWTVDGPTVVATPDYHFLIDNLLIVRNGTTYFNDDFGAGGPPPQAPNLFGTTTPVSYLMQGTLAEANGRAILDGSLSVPTSSLGSPQAFHNSSALLLTDNSTNLALGLKIDDSFTVEARFDLVLPEEELQSYAVRLIDFNGSDTVDVRLRRDDDGVLRVVMREVDVPTNSITLLDSVALAPLAGENQIVLRLTHDAATPGVIDASFDLLGAGPARHFDFAPDALGHIFGTGTPGDTSDDELFTRAQIVATAPSDLQNGVYGTLRVDADGEWSYALANNDANVQALAQGEHVTDTFTVRVTDEHGAFDTQPVTVDVVGSNDAPVISSASTTFGSVQEDFNPVASGQIVASDVDHGALLRYTVGPATQVPTPGGPAPSTFFTYRADYHFTLDQLRIERNTDVFVDDYDAGSPPPAAGGSLDGLPVTYLVPLGQYTESGGRLHLDGSLATAQRGIGNPNLTVGQLAVLATNNDPNDLTRGLKSDDDFKVEARFDLALPAAAGTVYGITLTDNSGSSLPQDQLGDSNMSLLVRRDAGGNLIVQLNDFDVVTDVGLTRQALPLEPEAGENQIVLRLIHDKDQPGLIHAEFDLRGGAGGPRTFAFTEVAHAFGAATPDYAGDDENWTRVQLVAFGPDVSNAHQPRRHLRHAERAAERPVDLRARPGRLAVAGAGPVLHRELLGARHRRARRQQRARRAGAGQWQQRSSSCDRRVAQRPGGGGRHPLRVRQRHLHRPGPDRHPQRHVLVRRLVAGVVFAGQLLARFPDHRVPRHRGRLDRLELPARQRPGSVPFRRADRHRDLPGHHPGSVQLRPGASQLVTITIHGADEANTPPVAVERRRHQPHRRGGGRCRAAGHPVHQRQPARQRLRSRLPRRPARHRGERPSHRRVHLGHRHLRHPVGQPGRQLGLHAERRRPRHRRAAERRAVQRGLQLHGGRCGRRDRYRNPDHRDPGQQRCAGGGGRHHSTPARAAR